MKTDLIETGIDIIGKAPWGTHFCLFYDSKQDLIDMLVPYFKTGLENNEFCIWVTSEPLGVKAAKTALKKEVKALDMYIRNGQIEFFEYDQWYKIDGIIDANKVLRSWSEKEKLALENGFDGLRLTGNTFWLEKDDWQVFKDYELAVDSVINYHKMLACCTYHPDRWGAYEVLDVISDHEFAIVKREDNWERVESAGRKRVENERREIEERFIKMFDASLLGVVLTDRSGNYIEVNDAMTRIFGYSKEELLTMGEKSLSAPGEIGIESKQVIGMLAGTSNGFIAEKHYIHKEGHIIHGETALSTIKDSEGNTTHIMGQIQDITERKQAEEALRKSEERYRELAESISDVFFAMDNDLKYTYWNYASEKLTGIAAKEAVGKSLYELFPDMKGTKAEKAFLKVLKSKKVQSFENAYRLDNRDYIFEVSAYPTTDGCSVFTKDITERKRVEDAVRKSEAKYRDLVETSQDLIWRGDIEGRFTYLNPAWESTLGYKIEEMLGHVFLEFKEPETLSRDQLTRKHVLSGGSVEDYETTYISKSGEKVQLVFKAKSLIDSTGQIVGTQGTAFDITERKEIELALQKAHDELEKRVEERTSELMAAQDQVIRSERLAATGQLAASVAHEINSPLQAITVILSTMKRDNEENKELLDNIDLVKGAFFNIRDTVKNLMNLNRPGKEQKQLTNVNSIIENTCALMKSHLKKNKVKIDLNLSSDVPDMIVSPQQFGHIFLNLINNSVEAMSGVSKSEGKWKERAKIGGDISIKTMSKKDKIIIQVSDTGPGIAEEDLEHILNPFYTRKKTMGTGVGLSICNGIIEDHNGTIEAKNAKEGGAVFTIMLPVKKG